MRASAAARKYAKRSAAAAPIKSFKEAYSIAERQEFDEEIRATVTYLHSLGKLPKDALALFKSIAKCSDKKRASSNTEGWTPLQVWLAFKLLCLLGLREAQNKPRSATIDAMVTLGRWLAEASQQTAKRNSARSGGRRAKLQADIVEACKDFRTRSPAIIARHAHRTLRNEGRTMPDGHVIRFEKPMAFPTFRRYWARAGKM